MNLFRVLVACLVLACCVASVDAHGGQNQRQRQRQQQRHHHGGFPFNQGFHHHNGLGLRLGFGHPVYYSQPFFAQPLYGQPIIYGSQQLGVGGGCQSFFGGY